MFAQALAQKSSPQVNLSVSTSNSLMKYIPNLFLVCSDKIVRVLGDGHAISAIVSSRIRVRFLIERYTSPSVKVLQGSLDDIPTLTKSGRSSLTKVGFLSLIRSSSLCVPSRSKNEVSGSFEHIR